MEYSIFIFVSMIEEEKVMDKLVEDLRDKISHLLDENEILKAEHEEVEIAQVGTGLDDVPPGSSSLIPPRSSSAVELLPHVLSRPSGRKRTNIEELEAIRSENRVLVAYLVKTLGKQPNVSL